MSPQNPVYFTELLSRLFYIYIYLCAFHINFVSRCMLKYLLFGDWHHLGSLLSRYTVTETDFLSFTLIFHFFTYTCILLFKFYELYEVVAGLL